MNLHEYIKQSDANLLEKTKEAVNSVYNKYVLLAYNTVFARYKGKRYHLMALWCERGKYRTTIVSDALTRTETDILTVPFGSVCLEDVRALAVQVADTLVLPTRIHRMFDKVKGRPFFLSKSTRGSSPVILTRFVSKDCGLSCGKKPYWIFGTDDGRVVSLCEANFRYHLAHAKTWNG